MRIIRCTLVELSIRAASREVAIASVTSHKVEEEMLDPVRSSTVVYTPAELHATPSHHLTSPDTGA